MLRKLLVAIMAGGALAALVLAQEGHPLTGSWHGDWGSTAKARTPIVMYMKWNNKSVEGTLNPGKNGSPLKAVTMNPADWSVHLEADTKAGEHVAADGKLADIGSYHRTITGTWTQGKSKGDFKLKRD
ncbi:MAG: hypothetical protein ABI995_08970 [Acidobacteriota bacterium]